MFKFLLVLAMLMVSCGYSSMDNELSGQVKRVIHTTPLLCPDRYDVDVSLGVFRNGVGSVSKHDMSLVVLKESDVQKLKDAASTGKIVKMTYNEPRFRFCHEFSEVTNVEILNN